ncbi:MAG: adenosine deaminase [Anaerolineaceae bacterium]|nr:adenosine deaminase [Anaerolineaceae bacterium]
MGWYNAANDLTFFKSLPKVELHRHLEGSVRVRTLKEIALEHNVPLPPQTGQLRPLVQIQSGDPLTSGNFLSKFQPLRQFYRSPEVITRVAREAVEDAVSDGIQYLELRFTPVALGRSQNFPLDSVMDWVIESTQEASRKYGITTRLIASVNRHESPELAKEVAGLAADRIDKGIVGLDMAGDEVKFPAQPFAGIFREAKQAGLFITLHAGEWSGAENVREAVEDLHADRIGHGVRVMDDPDVVAMVRERNIPFEVCITSNYQSGVVSTLEEHPFMNMLKAGLNVTLNTDDPEISGIILSDEYYMVCSVLKLSREALKDRIVAAAGAAFLPAAERRELVNSLRDTLLDIF